MAKCRTGSGKVTDSAYRTAVICIAAVAVTWAGLAACSSGSGSPSPGAGESGTAISSKVSFVADGTTTYGTLEVPAHRSGQHLAAALLMAGSGPTDRNGNDAGLHVTPDTLQLVANTLARDGIMSLRFDKYFAGQTGAGRLASNPGATTLNSFLRQAADAYMFLGAQPAADPTRMLMVGHSEGGMYALVLARQVSPKPAGLALLEPQDERILDLVGLQTDENIAALVAPGILSPSDGTTNEELVRQAIADFRAGRQVSTAGMAQSVIKLITAELLTPGERPLHPQRRRDHPGPVRRCAAEQHADSVHRRHPGPERPAEHDRPSASGARDSQGRRTRIPAAAGHRSLHAPGQPARQRARTGTGRYSRNQPVGSAVRILILERDGSPRPDLFILPRTYGLPNGTMLNYLLDCCACRNYSQVCASLFGCTRSTATSSRTSGSPRPARCRRHAGKTGAQ